MEPSSPITAGESGSSSITFHIGSVVVTGGFVVVTTGGLVVVTTGGFVVVTTGVVAGGTVVPSGVVVVVVSPLVPGAAVVPTGAVVVGALSLVQEVMTIVAIIKTSTVKSRDVFLFSFSFLVFVLL